MNGDASCLHMWISQLRSKTLKVGGRSIDPGLPDLHRSSWDHYAFVIARKIYELGRADERNTVTPPPPPKERKKKEGRGGKSFQRSLLNTFQDAPEEANE